MNSKNNKKEHIEINLSIIKRAINNNLNDKETKNLLAWIKSSKEHERYYSKVCDFYINKDYIDINEDLIINKITNRVIRNKRKRIRTKYYMVASIIVIIFSTLLLLEFAKSKDIKIYTNKETPLLITSKGEKIYLENGNKLQSDLFDSINIQKKGNILIYDSVKRHTNEVHTLIIPKGLDYFLSLSDGTKVWLNSCTTFSFPINFSKSNREVSLNGEAFFEVAKDSNRAFRINMEDFKIKVYGTKFNVDCYSKRTLETTLVEGCIGIYSVNHKFKEVKLNIGNKIEIDRKYYSYRMSIVDIESVGDWRKGYFTFDNHPLEKIMNKLKHWYNIEIQYEDESLKYKRFSGRISRKKDINGILGIIERTMLVKFNIRNNIITISSVKK